MSGERGPAQDTLPEEAGQVLICPVPGCGSLLPVPPGEGVRILIASFPDEPEQVAAMLAGAMREVTCTQCGTTSPYESAAVFVMPDRGKVLIFVPERVARVVPDLKEQIVAGIQPALEEQGISVDLVVFADVEAFRAAVGREIRDIAAPLLSEFSIADFKGGEALDAWLNNSADRLDREFFAAAWLVSSGAVILTVHVGTQVGHAEELSKLGAHDVLSELRVYLRQILAYRLLHLSNFLADQHKLQEIEKATEEVVHPVVLEVAALRTFADGVAAYERDSDVPSFRKYAADAVLAAACLLGGERNPRQDDWVGWYVAIEITARDPNSGTQVNGGLRVPLAFARRTIDLEDLWPQAIPRLRSLVTPKEGQPPRMSALTALMELMDDFGAPVTWMSEALVFDIERLPADTVDHLEQHLLNAVEERQAGAEGFGRIILGSFARSDPQRFYELSRRLVERYCDLADLAAAASIACYTSEELNARSLCRAAWAFLQNSRATIETHGSWSDLSAGTRASFLTEEGNSLRYLGRPQEALQKYMECESLVGADLSKRDVRVNEQNRAIVLRELGQVEQSQSILRSLIPYTEGAENGKVLLSLAQACEVVNQMGAAEALIGQALANIQQTPMNVRLRRRLLLAGADLARRRGRADEALQYSLEALKLLDTAGLFEQALVVAVAAAAADDADLEPAKRENINDLTINILEGAVAASGDLGPSVQDALQLRFVLARRYDVVGRPADGERLLTDLASRPDITDVDQAWKVWAELARYAALRKDGSAARERLEKAYGLVLKRISTLGSGSDDYSLMLDKDPLHRAMAQVLLDSHASGQVDAAVLRVAADLQNSLVLQHRLGRSIPAASALPLHTATLDAAAVRQLLEHPRGVARVAALQFLETVGDIRALLTIATAEGLETTLLPASFSVVPLTRLRQRLLFGIEMWSPAREGDPLTASGEWREFAAQLCATVAAALPAGAPLWIVPGATLSGLPLHAALAGAYPCSYVPSLAIARTLRERRCALPGGAEWRPSSFFDFMVWQYQERAEVIAAFRAASQELSATMKARGVSFESAMGTSATQPRLLEALSQVDCLRLACHGFAAPDSLKFQLLISNGVQLPPSSPRALQSDVGQQFLLNWADLMDLTACPPLIFSSACASGSAAGVPGGERMGLERPLLAAGALAYVAPQWSVPVTGIQPLLNQVIITYLTEPTRTLSEVLAEKANNAIAAGLPAWIAHSLAIHGDWL